MSVFGQPGLKKNSEGVKKNIVDTVNTTEVINKIIKYRELNSAIQELKPLSDFFDGGAINLDGIIGLFSNNLGDIGFTGAMRAYYRKVLKEHNLRYVFNDDVGAKLIKDYGIKRIGNKIKGKEIGNSKISGTLGTVTQMAVNNIYPAHKKILAKLQEAKDYIGEELNLQGIKLQELDKPSLLIANIQSNPENYNIKPLPKNHRVGLEDLPKDTRANLKQILSI